MCTRFNIDVIKSQLDLIQPASFDQTRFLSFLFFSLSRSFLRFVDECIFFSFSSKTHSLVSRWSSFNSTHQNKRVNRPIVSFLFLHRHHSSLFLHARLNIIYSLVEREREEEKKTRIFSFSLALFPSHILCIAFHTSYKTERDD